MWRCRLMLNGEIGTVAMNRKRTEKVLIKWKRSEATRLA